MAGFSSSDPFQNVSPPRDIFSPNGGTQRRLIETFFPLSPPRLGDRKWTQRCIIPRKGDGRTDGEKNPRDSSQLSHQGWERRVYAVQLISHHLRAYAVAFFLYTGRWARVKKGEKGIIAKTARQTGDGGNPFLFFGRVRVN